MGFNWSVPVRGNQGTALAREGVFQRSIGFATPLGRNGRVTLRSSPADAYAAYRDRKSTRLNSSHSQISYAVFCLKKKKKTASSSQHPCAISGCRALRASQC